VWESAQQLGYATACCSYVAESCGVVQAPAGRRKAMKPGALTSFPLMKYCGWLNTGFREDSATNAAGLAGGSG
jgi:hypothetical protein